MKVALCLTKASPRGRYILDCFSKGIKRHGDSIRWVAEQNKVEPVLSKSDLAVQICVSNKHDTRPGSAVFRHEVRRVLQEQNKRCLIIDSGFLNTQTDLELKQDIERPEIKFSTKSPATFTGTDSSIYYEVGYDGLKRHAQYYNACSPPTRWKKLGYQLHPWRHDKKLPILFLGQTYHGASSQHISIYKWYREAALAIRDATNQRILFRQHPRIFKVHHRRIKDTERVSAAFTGVGNWSFCTNWTLEESLQNASAVVVFSSNAAVMPVIQGIPTFVADDGCMAWDVRSGDPGEILSPHLPDRTQWAYNLAYAQWNCTELRNGECWEHFKAYGQRRPATDEHVRV